MELPDELKELKLRLQFELDSNITDRVIDEWYEEYQVIVNANDGLEKDASLSTGYWRHWALQNIS